MINGVGDENTRIELGQSHEVDRKHWHSLFVALY